MYKHWAEVKSQYIEGKQDKGSLVYPTYAALSEEFKVDAAVIGRRAAKEGWVEQRKLFRHKVDTLRMEKKSEILASESAQLASDCLKVSRAGIAVIVAIMESSKPSKIPIDRLMSALVNAQKVGQNALGETEAPAAGLTTITVVSERAKQLTEQVLRGEGTE
ncbi:MAG: hypothetical protein WC566_05780 [Dehalococcoidia bacterium]